MTSILIIDDDLDVRDQVATTLLASYYETHTAIDGRDGIEKALSLLPDLIICDMMMPYMDGQSVLTELRQHQETASIPFIFLTAVDGRDTIRASMNLGADDYLLKPFTVTELQKSVSARLKRHQSIVTSTEQQLEDIKLRLARTITHELRTPVGLVSTALQMLQWELKDQLPQDALEIMQTMERGATRIAHVVEQMVYATHLTAGVYTTKSIAENSFSIEVSELLNAANKLARQFTNRQPDNVEVKIVESKDALLIKADVGALKQALAELISNAIAFSPVGGIVRILYRRVDNEVRITITDSGHGIADSQLKDALAWFGQIDREKQEQQGMGMGLPLANQLITIHGGTLDVRSVIDKGTQAIVTLPLAEHPR